MVKHIVMWKLNETCDKKQASGEIKTALEGLMGKIPGMRACRVSPAYKGTYDLVLETELTQRRIRMPIRSTRSTLNGKKIVHSYIIDRAFADFKI